MNPLQRYYYLGQALGWDNIPRRVWQIAKGRLGLNQRRLPGGELDPAAMRAQFVSDYAPETAGERWQQRRGQFFGAGVTSDDLARVAGEKAWSERVTHVVDELRAGRLLMFSHRFDEAGFPPDFNRDPLHDVAWPTGNHWSTYQQFDTRYADLKCVWEASRFSWAYHLARGHVRAPDAGIDATWWTVFDAWDRQNPYGLSAQWACGQESTFRLFAWLFAALRMPAERTPAQWDRLTQLVWYTARHIDGNINYARSQKNNHAISEAVGLWAIGILFPEFVKAEAWREKGSRILAAEVARQVADDGSYIQNSVNYHRVMLDDLLWAAAVGRAAGVDLPDVVLDKARPALDWLLQMIEPAGGRCPNYGLNDGAQVLQLSTCDYSDFRPVAQAACYWLHDSRCFPPGPHDEKLLWLFGPQTLAADVTPRPRTPNWSAPQGGYYTFAGPHSWGLTRAHSYRTRPGEADMLHFDLWYDGRNLLRDAGSYHYYCEERLQDYFKSTVAHNTATVDGQDQMIPGPRFLWLRWLKSEATDHPHPRDERVSRFSAWHNGFARLPARVTHTRGIDRIDDTYLVRDELVGRPGATFEAALRWRIGAADWSEQDGTWRCDVPSGAVQIDIYVSRGPDDVARITPDALSGQLDPQVEGWESRYYADRQPVTVLRAVTEAHGTLTFLTIIRHTTGEPGAIEVARRAGRFVIRNLCPDPGSLAGELVPDVELT